MEVWLVTQTSQGDGTQVIAVFSYYKRAELFSAKVTKEPLDDVEGWEVDLEPEVNGGRLVYSPTI